MWIYRHCIDEKCDLVIHRIFSPTQVGASNYSVELRVNLSLVVADTCVMLALMAGRNAGKGVTLVKEGKVSSFSSQHPHTSSNDQVLSRAPAHE